MSRRLSTNRITIRLSDRRPISISPDDWPSVAYGEGYAGEHACQSFDGAWIRVRAHADGRTIVYGFAGDWTPGRADKYAGYLLARGEDVARAIRRVQCLLATVPIAGAHAAEAAADAIASLPAEKIG